MKLCSLSSGSKGNSILVYTDKTKILVDCGISGKALDAGLKEINISPESLDAIVITHEHSDHTKGIGIVARKYSLPVFASEGTGREILPLLKKVDSINFFKSGDSFQIGDIAVSSFKIPHDAAEPVGYRFDGDDSVAVATDIGVLEEQLFVSLKGCKTVLLEANHDINLLEMGSYPIQLKQRIRSKYGHLSNEDAGFAAAWLARFGTKQILLGHLSEENNYPLLALETVKNVLTEKGVKVGDDLVLDVALQNEVSKIYA